MPSTTLPGKTPSLQSFLKSLKQHPDNEKSIALLTSLLKRRQIQGSRSCAIATAQLLLRVVGGLKTRDGQMMIERVNGVGKTLVKAQPKELAVGNVVRRVLGVIREVADDSGMGQDVGMGPNVAGFDPLSPSLATPLETPQHPTVGSPTFDDTPDGVKKRPPLPSSSSYAGQGPQASSLLSFLEHPTGLSPVGTPPTGTGTSSPSARSASHQKPEKIDLKAEVLDGIKDLLDEIDVSTSQIAETALDHIHSGETLLTKGPSATVQKFLANAARKRPFTLFHAEAYPNAHATTHFTVLNGARAPEAGDERWKPLTALGITVVLVPDTAVFALMPRVDKVLLSASAVLADGSLLAAAGTATTVAAAAAHRVPVVALAGVYKMSPLYPYSVPELIEYGDPGKVVPYADGDFMERVDVGNPLVDWVASEEVDLYVTNLGGVAARGVERVLGDHYWKGDLEIGA